MPELKSAVNHGVSCVDLAASIKSVAWAASTEVARYILMSVLIRSSAKSLEVVSTNSRELALCETALIGSDFELVAPSDFVGNLCASLSRDGATLSSNENQIRVSHNDGEYFCKKVDGNYPNYKQVIPAKLKTLGTVSVEEFKSAVASCAGYSGDSEAKGNFTFTKKGVTIELVGDNGSKTVRNIAGSFSDLKIMLATKKMLKIFSNLKGDEAKILFVDELTPIAIDSGGLRVVTSPMRMA